MACSRFGRRFRRGLRFRQIDLNFRLIFFESGRDDEKDEQDRQDIDERNDDDGGRPPFPDCESSWRSMTERAASRDRPGARAGSRLSCDGARLPRAVTRP